MDEGIIVGSEDTKKLALFPAGECFQEQMLNELIKTFLNLIL